MKQIALAIILFWTCSLIYKILIGFDSSVMEVDEILVVPNLTYWFGKDDSSVNFVENRWGQDLRYSISNKKLKDTGWQPEHPVGIHKWF